MKGRPGASLPGEEPAPGAGLPGPLISLIIGETGRSSQRARSRRPPASGPGGTGSNNPPPAVVQWSCRWSAGGPGPIMPGCEGEPDLALALSPADAQEVKEGALSPSVAFMQGRLKSSGDSGLLLQVLEWSAGPAWPRALEDWQAVAGRAGDAGAPRH
ncbi:MAG: SCP2 sterol-binding domain-containing protein [Acidimicrobiales bacterium]